MPTVKLNLPTMQSDIARRPMAALPLSDGDGTPMHRIHVIPADDGGWQWAHLLRAMSGWEVIAAGVLDGDGFPTPARAAREIADRFHGEDGTGYDRLPTDRFMQVGGSPVAHLTRDAATTQGYCGASGGVRAEFGTQVKGHAEQHCIHCDRIYRAEHYGRMALAAR